MYSTPDASGFTVQPLEEQVGGGRGAATPRRSVLRRPQFAIAAAVAAAVFCGGPVVGVPRRLGHAQLEWLLRHLDLARGVTAQTT